MTLITLQNDVILLFVFLLIGFAIREIVKPLQKLYIPASVVSGVIALIVGQQVLGLVTIPESWGSMSGVLINLVMTAMVFGVTIKKNRVRMYMDYACFILFGFGVQIAIGVGVGMLLQRFWQDLPHGWGLMSVFAFWGGHGTVAASGAVFAEYGIADNTGLGMILATFGLILAIVVGMIIVNWGIRKEYAKHLTDENKSKAPRLSGAIPKEEQNRIGSQTVSALSINSLALQLAFLLLALFIGMKLVGFITIHVPALAKIPMQVRGMIGAVILWPILCKLKLDGYTDKTSMNIMSGFCLEIIICSAIATLRLDLVTAFMTPILIMTGIITVIMIPFCIYFGKHLCKQDWFEKTLLFFGQGLGNTSTGLALVRCADPEMKSTAYEASGIGSTIILPITGTFPALMPILIMTSELKVIGIGILISIICIICGRIFFWQKS